MSTARSTAILLVISTFGISARTASGESNADLVTHIISSSPRSPGSFVKARVVDCSLILHQIAPGEKKRTIIPLRELDERSFKTGMDPHFASWYVEVHTLQERRAIRTGSAKWSASLPSYLLYIEGQEDAGRLRTALGRLVRSCRRPPKQT
jgi:hypothetical protein